MEKQFFISVSILLFMIGAIALHYITFDTQTVHTKLSEIVAITKLPSPSLSVAFYEPRVFLLEHARHPAYPQMQAIDKMDFVYAQ
ncbi:hypothetical protein MNB_SV-4-496 [hydrothermal vent metagenome]|uniref:Uncharacterized protein n=1 Tax=hydrothermal vent metagenome TaxID=652676 RepID=A0A1W1EAF8_9ZZZZ